MTTNQTNTHLHDGINQRIQEADERLADLQAEVGKRIDSLGVLVKGHPLAALGVALGIGYLLARLLHRSP